MLRWLLIVGLLTIGCHGSQRENPLDPDLTPDVADVTAEASDAQGVLLLNWSAYDGDMAFAAYVVLRKEQGLEAVDTLGVLTAVQHTSFRDSTAAPDRNYEYRIGVVNEAGYLAGGQAVLARSYRVFPVLQLQSQPNESAGTIALSWETYSGPGFNGYEVWRESFGVELSRLAVLSERETSAWIDTTVVPEVLYSYRLRVRAFDQQLDTESPPVAFGLTAPTIETAELDWSCACASLSWSQYDGPGFVGYDIMRRAAGIPDSLAAHIAQRDVTVYIDSLLVGNTTYAYQIVVRTVWEGATAASSEAGGAFYRLEDVRNLSAASDTEVRAIDLALDDVGGVWAVSSAISTTTARQMRSGLRVHDPTGSARVHLTRITPGSLSPVRAIATADRIYAVVADDEDSLQVVAISSDDGPVWQTAIGTGAPAGIYLARGDLVVVDRDNALSYHLDPTSGVAREGVDAEALRKNLVSQEGLPLQDLYYDSLSSDFEQAFLLAPENSEHKVISRLWLGNFFGGGAGYYHDVGIGPGAAQFLDPLSVAFDAANQRLVVIESSGRLQVLDASEPALPAPYITGWGRFGSAPGEFLVSPGTAVSVLVDSQGRVHVADAGAEGGRIQTFVP